MSHYLLKFAMSHPCKYARLTIWCKFSGFRGQIKGISALGAFLTLGKCYFNLNFLFQLDDGREKMKIQMIMKFGQ